MTSEQQEILAFFNSERTEKVTLETAKGMYIPRERILLESRFPKQIVDAVFGEATWLEQAEMAMLEGQRTDIICECERLVSFATCIAISCRTTEKESIILESYKHVEVNIPIRIMMLENVQFDTCEVKETKSYLTIYQLRILGEYLNIYQNNVTCKAKCSFYRYLIELVEASLCEIFEIVKKELI